MKTDRVAVNASPLIALFQSDLASLLSQLFSEILVPGAVWEEVLAGGPNDPASQQLVTALWAKRVEVAQIPSIITAWNLGQGESEVLSVALDNPDCRAMIDDAAARRCARAVGVPTLGTGGAIVLAKRRGLIPSAADALQKLRNTGLWLSDDLVTLLLEQAGEE
ncbi:MAG: DUF3368 domain-containing protein [Acidobacteriota bacterium]